jgi:hypothetical protein
LYRAFKSEAVAHGSIANLTTILVSEFLEKGDTMTIYPTECNPDCAIRSLGCHTDCPKYARDEAKRAEQRNVKFQALKANTFRTVVQARRAPRALKVARDRTNFE